MEEEEGWTLGSRSYLTFDRNRRFRKSILDVVVLYDDINCRVGDVFKLSCRVNCVYGRRLNIIVSTVRGERIYKRTSGLDQRRSLKRLCMQCIYSRTVNFSIYTFHLQRDYSFSLSSIMLISFLINLAKLRINVAQNAFEIGGRKTLGTTISNV